MPAVALPLMLIEYQRKIYRPPLTSQYLDPEVLTDTVYLVDVLF